MNTAEELRLWALKYLPDGIAGGADATMAPVAGDAGFRSYFRLTARPSLIAVHAPPGREDNPAFVTKGLAMKDGGVHVPDIHAVDFQRGFLLLEDLGDVLYLPQLNESTVDRLYDSAESVLRRIQQLTPDESVFPAYSDEMLHGEMALFPQWFVAELLGQNLDAGDRAMLDELFGLLTASAREQPAVVVHRDYHSRNLLSLPDGDVGVVDFQDAVSGPVTYDLVSLLKDCYIRWPEQEVSARALAYLARAVRGVDEHQLQRWFDWMGLQRHLKVLGIFARLWLRDGKSRYLDDLPLVIRYTLEVTAQYPQLRDFHNWFLDRLLPVLRDQPWYRPWHTAGE